MESNNYLKIDNQLDEITAIAKEQQELDSLALTDLSAEKWLDLKDECEARYQKLGKWIVDQIKDCPF
ncbi:hypothetical protein [Marinobacter sp.]|uniref:hypothetical protein n=1 Tax=Marinobacter sp. TaxID=50741 RepID=UPI0034A4D470